MPCRAMAHLEQVLYINAKLKNIRIQITMLVHAFFDIPHTICQIPDYFEVFGI